MVTFPGIADFAGGAGADDFVVADGATLAGAIDGGAGADTLDFGASTSAVAVTLLGATGAGFAGTATPHGGGFAGIDRLVGGTAADHLTGLTPYEPSFTGGVRVAVGDVNADGVADVVAGAGDGGGPRVRVYDGRTGSSSPGRTGRPRPRTSRFLPGWTAFMSAEQF